MTAADVLRTGSIGLRTRRARAALSALGVAIGIASMVAVLGISESSRADLMAQPTSSGPTCCGSRRASPSRPASRSCPRARRR